MLEVGAFDFIVGEAEEEGEILLDLAHDFEGDALCGGGELGFFQSAAECLAGFGHGAFVFALGFGDFGAGAGALVAGEHGGGQWGAGWLDFAGEGGEFGFDVLFEALEESGAELPVVEAVAFVACNGEGIPFAEVDVLCSGGFEGGFHGAGKQLVCREEEGTGAAIHRIFYFSPCGQVKD